MRLVILGAAGKTGRHLVEQALAAGHTVTAFVRNGEIAPSHARLKVVTGDARSRQDLAAALAGNDAVLSALGSNKPGDNIITQSTTALIDAMLQTNVQRIIMMSSFLVTPNFEQKGIARIVGWLMHAITSDKTLGEELLKKSSLDWTIVYATRLDGVSKGDYRVVAANETISLKNTIAREDVAECMIMQLTNPEASRKSLLITSD